MQNSIFNSYSEAGIEIPSGRMGGHVKTKCPQCRHNRKNKTDKPLSVDVTQGVWKCHNCHWSGALRKENQQREYSPRPKTYVRPEWHNKTELSDEVVKYFEGRKIDQNVLRDMKISEGVTFMPQTEKKARTIQFNYFEGETLVNVKYRDREKNFKMVSGAEKIPYNVNALIEESKKPDKNSRKIYITEGEMDCLTFLSMKHKNVVSVPNGATVNPNDPSNSRQNLDWIDRFYALFEKIETIVICTDNDLAGRVLREALAVRLGIEKCKFIEYGEHKDINEMLMKEGVMPVLRTIQAEKDFPIKDVCMTKDFSQAVMDIKKNGYPVGAKTGMPEVDIHLQFHRKYMTCITGIPSHGKSDFTDQTVVRLSVYNDWKFAFFTPENKPTEVHIIKLVRKLLGKPLYEISEKELSMALDFINEHFYFIVPEKDFTPEYIMERVQMLKRKYGIDGFIIDAWNRLDHMSDTDMVKYTGKMLDSFSYFCVANDVHFFLVAHPRKMVKKKDGTGYERVTPYDISGTADFFNKFDNIVCVTRFFEEGREFDCDVDFQKVKFDFWGKVGIEPFHYDPSCGRYYRKPDTDPWIIGVEPAQPKPVELPTITAPPPVDYSEPTFKTDEGDEDCPF